MVVSLQDDSPEGNPEPTLPAAIVSVSALTAAGLDTVQAAVGSLFPKRQQAPDSPEALLAQVKPAKDDSWL